ncbi:MAG TPA: AmmeMemoRadiSam system protein B [Chloroflexota bacterium]|nr:AmmeMemoRadiSam system protein B [Chloroflexota bacterium]
MVDIAPDRVGFPLAERPRLRPVEVFPTRHQGQRGLVLRDTTDRDLAPMFISDGTVPALELLDGRRTIPDIVQALSLRGMPMTESQLRTLLTRLDEAGYLEGARAVRRLAQRTAAFREAPVRRAVFAGGAYPDAPALPQFLAEAYCDAQGPGALPAAPPSDAQPLRAAIAPHIDPHRGAPTYSFAYKALAEAQRADVYVILGTCHTPVVGHFAATSKAYETPLGAVPADQPFLEQLGRQLGTDLYAGEFSHVGEHSIEFQAVYLRSLGLAGEGQAAIVPILCDSLHSMVPPARSPSEISLVSDFLAALRRTVASDGRTITFIAAVDLAHVGPRFGDDWRVDQQHQERVRREDAEMLELIVAPDADAYYAQVMRDRDARRICGFTPIYLLTALMEGEQRQGEVLRYQQWVDTDLSSSVTFVSAIFR